MATRSPVSNATVQDSARRGARGMGLRAVGLGLLASVLLPIVILLGLAWHFAQASLEARARDDLAGLAALMAAAQAQWVEGTRQTLISIANAPAVQAGDWPACNDYLRQLGRRLPGYVSVGVLDDHGQMRCSTALMGTAINLADRPYAQRALRQGEFSVGNFMMGRITGNNTVPFALPIADAAGTAHGAVVAGMDLKFLHERLRAVSLPTGVWARIADAQGNVLATSGTDASIVGSPLAEPALLAAVLAGATGGHEALAADGTPAIQHVSPITVSAHGRLHVVVSAARSDLLAPGPRQLGLLAAAILAFLPIYAALVGVAGVRWMVSPLRRLVHAVRLIERDRYSGVHDQTTDGAGVREVQELQAGLHAMWQGLQRRGQERDAALAASDAARGEVRAVFDQMDDGFMILDSQWRIKLCNQRVLQLVERTAAVGLPFWELFPDERSRTRRERCVHEVNAGRTCLSEDFHARYGRWFEIRFSPSPDGIGVFLRDATERWKMTHELMESEQRYRELFEANPNVMWIFDVETLGFLAVNQAAVTRYGYSREEFLSMDITDMGPADDREEVAQQVRRSMGSGGAALYDDPRIWRHMTKSAETILVEATRHQITFENRLAQLVMVTDVTARLAGESKLRSRLEKVTARLTEADSALLASRQMLLGHVGLLHHEVLPLLRRMSAHPPQPEHAGDAGLAQDAARVETLLGEAMRLAQVSRARLRRERVDLHELAAQALYTLSACDPHRVVHLDIDPHLECDGDPALLAQLMEVLLDNAWKFTAHRAEAWIRVGRLDRQHGAPAFCVSDSGIGFDEAQQGRLFMPFERLNPDAQYPGHGLGLAIAKAVVLRHGGRLWAHATPGQGATFCFELEAPPEESLWHVSEVVIDSVIPLEE